MLDRFDVDSPGRHAPERLRSSRPVLCPINHISRTLPHIHTPIAKLWVSGLQDVPAPLSKESKDAIAPSYASGQHRLPFLVTIIPPGLTPPPGSRAQLQPQSQSTDAYQQARPWTA